MDIHHAIRCDDWEQFSSLLDKVNPLDQDELNGDTILHCLAEKIDEVNPVKKFGSLVKTMGEFWLR